MGVTSEAEERCGSPTTMWVYLPSEHPNDTQKDCFLLAHRERREVGEMWYCQEGL